MFKIDKAVPIPAIVRESKLEDVYVSIKDTFKALSFNADEPDSFMVPNEVASSKVLKSRVKELLTPVLEPGQHYKYKVITQNNATTGLRIWKIAATEPKAEASNSAATV